MHSTQLHSALLLSLPSQGTNLLPLHLRHPELVVAQEEGPHCPADLRLDTPVVDESQQLLLRVSLWGRGQKANVRSTEKPGWPVALHLVSW